MSKINSVKSTLKTIFLGGLFALLPLSCTRRKSKYF